MHSTTHIRLCPLATLLSSPPKTIDNMKHKDIHLNECSQNEFFGNKDKPCTCPDPNIKKCCNTKCCEMCHQHFKSGLVHCLGIATCSCHSPLTKPEGYTKRSSPSKVNSEVEKYKAELLKKIRQMKKDYAGGMVDYINLFENLESIITNLSSDIK